MTPCPYCGEPMVPHAPYLGAAPMVPPVRVKPPPRPKGRLADGSKFYGQWKRKPRTTQRAHHWFSFRWHNNALDRGLSCPSRECWEQRATAARRDAERSALPFFEARKRGLLRKGATRG